MNEYSGPHGPRLRRPTESPPLPPEAGAAPQRRLLLWGQEEAGAQGPVSRGRDLGFPGRLSASPSLSPLSPETASRRLSPQSPAGPWRLLQE